MSDLRLVLEQAWLKKGLIGFFLWPVSLVYGLLIWVRRFFYFVGIFPAQSLAVPVVVIGNVFIGGVGKTPLVIALVKQLTQRGLKVGVLSRGYGRNGGECLRVNAQSLAIDVGDEPLLIARSCQVPVYVGNNKFQAGCALLAQNPQVQLIVCDDGLQHLALTHDLALCVFDERGLGNGWLLPAGPLREPWPMLRYANSPVISLSTATHLPREPKVDFQITRALDKTAKKSDGTTRTLASFRGQTVQALAGIGKPQSFFNMLADQGLVLSSTDALADHDTMRALQIDPSMGDVLCTEKDAVKLWQYLPTAWAVPLITEIPQELVDSILARIGPKLSSAHGHQTT
jgi:tetraacyldisaccharide 4'-kinase